MGVNDERKDKSGKIKPPLLPKPCTSSSMAASGEHVIPQMIITAADDISEEIGNAAKTIPVIAITESDVTFDVADVKKEATSSNAASASQTAFQSSSPLSSKEIVIEEQLQTENEALHPAPLVIESEKSIPVQQESRSENDKNVPIQAPTAMQRPLVFDGSKTHRDIEPDLSIMAEEDENNEAELQLVFNSSKETKDEVSSTLTDKSSVPESKIKSHNEDMKTKPSGFLKKHGFSKLHFGGKDSAETHTEKVNAQSELQKEQDKKLDGQHGIKHFFTSLLHESEDKHEKQVRQEDNLEHPKEESYDLKHGVKKFFDSFKHDSAEQNKILTHCEELKKSEAYRGEIPLGDTQPCEHGRSKSADHTGQEHSATEEHRDMKHSVKKFFSSLKHDSPVEEKSKSSRQQDLQKELEESSKDTPKAGKHSVKKFFDSFKHEATEDEKERSSKHQPIEIIVGKEPQKESKHGIKRIFDSFTHKEASSSIVDSKLPVENDCRNEHIYDEVRSPDFNRSNDLGDTQADYATDEFKRHKEGHHGVKKLFDSFRHKDIPKPAVEVSVIETENKSENEFHTKVHFESKEPSLVTDPKPSDPASKETTKEKSKESGYGHSFKNLFGSAKEKDSYKIEPTQNDYKNSEIPDVKITFNSLIPTEDAKPSIFSSLKPKFMSKEKVIQSKDHKLSDKEESKVQEYDLQNAGTSDEFPEHVAGTFKPLGEFSGITKSPSEKKKDGVSKTYKHDKNNSAVAPHATVEMNGYEADEPESQHIAPKSKEPETPESLYETCCVRLATLLRNKALDIVAERTKSPPRKPPKPSAEAVARARAATVEKRVIELQRRQLNFGDDIPIGVNGIRYVDDETESSGDYKDVENMDYIMDYELVNRYKFDNKLDTFSVPSTCSGMTSYYTADTATLKDENFSDNALETVSLDSSDSYLFKHLSFVQAKSDISLEPKGESVASAKHKDLQLSHTSSSTARPQSASPTSGQSSAQTGAKRVPPPIPPKPIIMPKSMVSKGSSPKSLPEVQVGEVSQCVNSLSLSPRLSVKGKGDSAGTQKRPLTIADVKETEFSSLRKINANEQKLPLKDRKFNTVLKNESLRNLPSVGPFHHAPLAATKSSPPQLAVTKSSPDLTSLRKISPQRPPPPKSFTPVSDTKQPPVVSGSTSPKAPEKPKRESTVIATTEQKTKRTTSPPRPPPPVFQPAVMPLAPPPPPPPPVFKPTVKPTAPTPPHVFKPTVKPTAPSPPPAVKPTPPAVKPAVRSPPPRPPPPAILSPSSTSIQGSQQGHSKSLHSDSRNDTIMVNEEVVYQNEMLTHLDSELEEKAVSSIDFAPKAKQRALSSETCTVDNKAGMISVQDEFSSDAHVISADDLTRNDSEAPNRSCSFDFVEVSLAEEISNDINLQLQSEIIDPELTNIPSKTSENTVKVPQRKPKPPPRTRRIRSRTVEVVPSEKMTEPRKRRSQSLSDVEIEKRVCSMENLPTPEKIELKHLYTAVNKNGKRGSLSADAELKTSSSSLDAVPSRPLPPPPPPPRKFRSLGRKPKEREKDSCFDSKVDESIKPPVRRRKSDKKRFLSLGSGDVMEYVEPSLEGGDGQDLSASSIPFRPERRQKRYGEPSYDENANVSFPVVAEVHQSELQADECEGFNQNIPSSVELEFPVERITETMHPHPWKKKSSDVKATQHSSWYDQTETFIPEPRDTSWEFLDWTPGQVVDVQHQPSKSMRRRSEPIKRGQPASTFYVNVEDPAFSLPLAVDKETSPLPLDCSEKSVQTSLETLSHGVASRDEQSDDTDELLDLAQTLQNELKTIINRHKSTTEYNESEDSSQTPPLSVADKEALSCTDKKVKKNDSVRSSTSELWQMTSSEESEGELAHGGSANLTEIALSRKQKKIFYVAQEIMTSEEVFVDALKLLNVDFKSAVDSANKQRNAHVIPDETLCQILNHLPQLQHLNENLLMELKDRIENWEKVGKIADIIVKMGPFLKLYSWFIHDFESTVALLEDSKKKYPLFAQAVSEFERTSRCKRLTLNHYLLKPIQRIPQYRLLLQEYLHHLPEDSPDYQDTVTALQIVSEVANHANDSMKQGDNVQKLFSIQNSILGHKEIIKPGRIFIKEGELMKLSRKGMQPRWFVLLNDMLLYLTPVQQGLYRVNHELALTGMKVAIPIQQDYQNEFSIISVTRSFTLAARSPEERQEWIVALTKAIEENASKRSTFTNVRLQQRSQNKNSEEEEETFVLGRKAPVWIPDARVTMCQLCTSEFTVTFRRHHCRACGKVVCSICSSNRISLPYLGNRIARVCDECHIKIGPGSGGCTESGETDSDNQQIAIKPHLRTDRHIKKGKRNLPSVLKEVCANDQGSTISGYLQLRSGKSWKRDWFVVKDKVLYEYKASEDVAALRSVPLLGYKIESFDESYEGIDPSLLLKLSHHGQAPIIFYADTVSSMERWLSALKEASVLE